MYSSQTVPVIILSNIMSSCIYIVKIKKSLIKSKYITEHRYILFGQQKKKITINYACITIWLIFVKH